jgi:hypothetical protein
LKTSLKFIFTHSAIAAITFIVTAILDGINTQALGTSFLEILNSKIPVWIVFLVYIVGISVYFLVYKMLDKKRTIKANKERVEYIEKINTLSGLLLLDYWDVFIDNAMRGLVAKEFIHNQRDYNAYILSIIWPKSLTKLKKKYLLLNSDYNKYVICFLRHAKLDSQIYREDKFYKAIPNNPDYERMLSEYDLWTKQWYASLHNYVFSLNNIIEQANKDLDSRKLLTTLRHKYLLEDTMGVYHSLQPTIQLPMKKIKVPK